MSRRSKWKEFYAVLAFLKKELPTDLPTYVRTRPLKKYWGITLHYPTHNMVIISTKQSQDQAIDTLIHEIAHARCGYIEQDVHGRKWAIEFGKVYRAWLKYEESKYE